MAKADEECVTETIVARAKGGEVVDLSVSPEQIKALAIRRAYLERIISDPKQIQLLDQFSLADIDANPEMLITLGINKIDQQTWAEFRMTNQFTEIEPTIAALIPGSDPASALDWYLGSASLIREPEESCPGISAAAAFISEKISASEKIALFGDYDVDGLTAVACLEDAVRPYDYQFHVGHANAAEGFGLSERFVREAAAAGCTTLITVDCGSASVAAVQLAQELGLEVVLSDHHRPAPDNPAEFHLNPQLHGSSDNVGAQVAWKLGAAIQLAREGLVRPEHYERARYLAGLGCFADFGSVVDPENRAFIVGAREHAPVGIVAIAEHFSEDPSAPGDMWKTQALMNLGKRSSSVDCADVATIIRARSDADLVAAGPAIERLVAADQRLADANKQANEIINSSNPAAERDPETGQTIRHQLDKFFATAVIEDSEISGASGTLASKLANRTGKPAIVFVRQGNDRQGEPIYKFSTRRASGQQQLLGQALIDNPEMRAACVSIGGHPQIVSGVCRADSIERISEIANRWASREKNFYDDAKSPAEPKNITNKKKIPRVNERRVDPGKFTKLLGDAKQAGPYRPNVGHYQPTISVSGQIENIQTTDWGSKIAELVLADGSRHRVGLDAKLTEQDVLGIQAEFVCQIGLRDPYLTSIYPS